jgi:Variant SH3 domain
VQFPTKVGYFRCTDDVIGDKTEGQLKLKRGAMVAVYRAEDKNWWLGKSGDEVGWVPAAKMVIYDNDTLGRRQNNNNSNSNKSDATVAAAAAAAAAVLSPEHRDWESSTDKFMSAAEIDMDHSDFTVVQAKTFDHMGSKVTAFFVQVSGVRKGAAGKNKGDIWVVAKTLKAFNRLRVAWEEDFGSNSIPVEPPAARWENCSIAQWDSLRMAALKTFLTEVKARAALATSQDLKHFLTTDRVNLAGGMITSKTMKPYLDQWVKTSSEPAWTQTLPQLPVSIAALTAVSPPGKRNSVLAADDKALQTNNPDYTSPSRFTNSRGSLSTPRKDGTTGVGSDTENETTSSARSGGKDAGLKMNIPGLRPGDESFGVLTSRRPRTRRSATFFQISALAAVTKQEMKLEHARYRKGWTEDGIKLQLLTQGGTASSLKRRSEKCTYAKYYDATGDGTNKALSNSGTRRGSYNQMKFETRFNLEKVSGSS